MSTIIVTGAAGLFGTHFTRYLLDKGHTVLGIDNLDGGYEDFIPSHENFWFSISDVQDIWRMPLEDPGWQELKKPIDCIYHFAAQAAPGLSIFQREETFYTNTIGSAVIINFAINHGIRKIVFASSMEVYGEGVQPPFKESSPLDPTTPYGISKLATELDLRAANIHHGLDYSIVRPHNVHGIYQNIWDMYRNVIGIFIRKAAAGENLVVYGDGEQVRAFSDIKFYMEPLYKLMTEGSQEAYNIGADMPCTINELAKIVQKVALEHGNAVDIVHAEARKEKRFAFCDHAKAKEELGFIDETNLETLVREMYDWTAKEPVRTVKKKKYEIRKNLYSYWK